MKNVGEIARLEQIIRRKNRELDALHYVWCDGGCERGVHRYDDEGPLTEEIVATAEYNVARMRRWLNNHQARINRPK